MSETDQFLNCAHVHRQTRELQNGQMVIQQWKSKFILMVIIKLYKCKYKFRLT